MLPYETSGSTQAIEWKCVESNPNDLLDFQEVLIPQMDVAIISRDLEKIKKHFFLFKAYTLQWFTCRNNEQTYIGISYHKTLNDVRKYIKKRMKEEPTCFLVTNKPDYRIINRNVYDEVYECNSVYHPKLPGTIPLRYPKQPKYDM